MRTVKEISNKEKVCIDKAKKAKQNNNRDNSCTPQEKLL